jgi:hypothetical protein
VTSGSRLSANRQNAAKSTGPRTGAGKIRSSRNALRHGLATSLLVDAAVAKQTEVLAGVIAGGLSADLRVMREARLAAVAHLELVRIRRVRHLLLGRLLTQEENDDGLQPYEPVDVSGTISELARIDRYERRALSRRKKLFRALIQRAEAG